MGRATGQPTTTSINKKLILIFLKFEIKQFKHVCAFQFLIGNQNLQGPIAENLGSNLGGGMFISRHVFQDGEPS